MPGSQITGRKKEAARAFSGDGLPWTTRLGYSSEQGLEEVQRFGVKVVSIGGAKGKKIIEAQKWKSRPYRQARAERSAIESLVFTLKEGFEFGRDGALHPWKRAGRDAGKSASLQYLSDHPGEKEAFRAARDGAGSGLIIKEQLLQSEIVKHSRAMSGWVKQTMAAPT
jgi:hypothetical protein